MNTPWGNGNDFNSNFQLKLISCRYFSKYSEPNCEVENRMSTSNELCGCLPYYYYKVDGVDVCNFTKIECLVQHFDELKVLTNDANNVSKLHRCLPTCDTITLGTHITSAPLNLNASSINSMDKF